MSTTLRLLPDLEESLRQIPGIRAVSVVTGPDARPTEVHVLTTPGKPPKQVVRDVQSLALAQHEIDIDHRIVSVVQIGEAEAPAPGTGAEEAQAEESSPRPAVGSIGVRTSHGECHVEVTLVAGDASFTGSALGPTSAPARARVVAAATLAALKELLGLRCEVDSAQVVAAGAREVALTVLTLAVPRTGDQVLTGSAPVRGDAADAVARSVLDALNRQLLG